MYGILKKGKDGRIYLTSGPTNFETRKHTINNQTKESVISTNIHKVLVSSSKNINTEYINHALELSFQQQEMLNLIRARIHLNNF